MFSLYTPTKVIRDASDPFFEEGNIAIRAYWLERDARSEQDIAIIREEASMLADDLHRPIFCEHSSCTSAYGGPIPFPSIAAYEEHYEARHCHVCLPCDKTFPNATFLQLHLDEYHDAFLKIRKERGEKIYQCFVEGCNKKCSTVKRRMQHLIEKHRYPSDYPFDIVATGTLSFEERQAHMKRQRTKELRKQRWKASLSSSSSSHEDNSTKQYQSNGRRNHDDDMDVDQLANSMAALSIPETISFGRGRPAFARRPQQQQHHHRQQPSRKSKRKEQQQQQQDMMDEDVDGTQGDHKKGSGQEEQDKESTSGRRRRRRRPRDKGTNDMAVEVMDDGTSQ